MEQNDRSIKLETTHLLCICSFTQRSTSAKSCPNNLTPVAFTGRLHVCKGVIAPTSFSTEQYPCSFLRLLGISIYCNKKGNNGARPAACVRYSTIVFECCSLEPVFHDHLCYFG